MKKTINNLFRPAPKRLGAFSPNMSSAIESQRISYEGYIKNVIVHRSVSLIARGLASVPWLLFEENNRLTQHPLITLMEQINPFQSRSTFFETVMSYYLLSGNAFIECLTNDDGVPYELQCLKPNRVEIFPGERNRVAAYCFRVDGKERWIPWEGEHSPVLHLKTFHPNHDWLGLSPLETIITAIEQHNVVSGHNLNLLQNGGRPTGALIVKTGSYGLTEEQRNLLREDIEHAYKGSTNAGKMLILEGDFEWREMGLSPRDMDFVDGKNQAAREIAQAFGVPPMLVGVPGDATFANYKEARFHLWEDTILPHLDHVIAEFNVWLTPQFGKNLRFSYDPDAVLALTPRREATWKAMIEADFLTQDEKR